MKKILKIILIFVSFLLVLIIISFVKRQRMDLYQEDKDAIINLIQNTSISQKFIAQHDNLSKIVILQANNSLIKNTKAGQEELLFSLQDESGNTIQEIKFFRSNIGSNSVIPFSFNPVKHSKNITFIFNIKTISINDNNEEPVIIGYAKNKKFQDKVNVINNQYPLVFGDISFVSYYKDRIPILVFDSVSDFINRAKQDKVFWLFYGSIIIFTVFFTITEIIKGNSKRKS